MARNLFEYHPVIGYRFIPGLRVRVRHEGGGYLVHTNMAGLRCRHEVTKAKPPGTVRIVVVGDSYTAGDGVSNAFRWTDVLEQRLLASMGGKGVQVLNFGLPGSGTDQQLLAFRELGGDLEYDIMLLAPMVENIVRNIDSHRLATSAFSGALVERPKPYFTLEGGKLVQHHVPVPKDTREPSAERAKAANDAPEESGPKGLVRGLLRKVTAKVDEKVPGFRAFTQRVRGVTHPQEYDDAQDPGWLLMRAILAEFIADARKDPKRKILLAPWPTFGHIEGGLDPKPYLARFAELAASTEIELLDALPRFLEEPRQVRDRCRFASDEHPTRLGHSVFADALFPHVRKHVEAVTR
jgi:carbamoyltransferase